MLSEIKPKVKKTGKVWLVGAGPGDPELLTLKAVRAIENADLILFDQLVGEAIKALFPKAIPAFYVGKKKGRHSIQQADLNKLLIKYAKSGRSIVRLKGGDPFMFGRGGEELLALRNEGIEVEVVPGITAAAACASTTHMPLTHRGIAQACTFLTGYAESKLDINWQALAAFKHTLVFYMGLSNARLIQENLLAAGMSACTSVAVVANASLESQQNYYATLDRLADIVDENSVKSPALIVIGDVVNLAEQLTTHNVRELLAVNQCA